LIEARDRLPQAVAQVHGRLPVAALLVVVQGQESQRRLRAGEFDGSELADREFCRVAEIEVGLALRQRTPYIGLSHETVQLESDAHRL
jgi:hypothetical protein